MQTLIYARYSSALQHDRSIEDQVTACRALALREGWPVVAVYDDRAISGAAGTGADQRPGLNALIARVEAGGIAQVMVDTTSRLARDLGDADRLRKIINFCGARLYSLADGEIDAFKGTFKALLDEHARREIAHNVRRAHLGNLAAGRSTGRVAYGYRKVLSLDGRGEPIRGLREIDADQAAIVARIFREYDAGQSPHAIAQRLNTDGVAPPRRGAWHAATIMAHRGSGFGILCNPIYIGQLVYGRTAMSVDPRTRRKRARVVAPGEWQIGEAPHLRIIDDELWRRVQDQIAARARPIPAQQRRPRHILSGLGSCGLCGGSWRMISGRNWGCAAATAAACSNGRTLATRQYERRVLADLRGQMLAPDVVAAYLREYHREHARQAGSIGRDRARLDRGLADAQRRLDRMVAAMAEGGGEFAEVRAAMTAARDERDRLRRELAGIDAIPVLTLHPGLADRYRVEIDDLDAALADEHCRLEAIPRLRRLISRIIIRPLDARGVTIEVVRAIDEVLRLATETPPRAMLR